MWWYLIIVILILLIVGLIAYKSGIELKEDKNRVKYNYQGKKIK